MYCVAVTYMMQAGHEQEAVDLLRNLVKETRTEQGNIMFIAHRSTTEPRQFFLYEQYTDQASFEAHRTTPHFQQYAANGIYKIIESRVAEFYETI